MRAMDDDELPPFGWFFSFTEIPNARQLADKARKQEDTVQKNHEARSSGGRNNPVPKWHDPVRQRADEIRLSASPGGRPFGRLGLMGRPRHAARKIRSTAPSGVAISIAGCRERDGRADIGFSYLL
jgi:hypothetical protein